MAQKLAFLDPGRRGDFMNGLNPRELEILRLLRNGKSMAEIAGVINVSYKTVANSCAILKRKLGARTPLDLVRIAVENKLA
jgi:DNA-binding CsgD family transcriptional regulator